MDSEAAASLKCNAESLRRPFAFFLRFFVCFPICFYFWRSCRAFHLSECAMAVSDLGSTEAVLEKEILNITVLEICLGLLSSHWTSRKKEIQ